MNWRPRSIPVGGITSIAVHRHKIPLAAKTAGAAFMAVLMPIYLNTYGITNFLWFCDAALVLTMVGMWLENSLLVSMSAAGILILHSILWGVHPIQFSAFEGYSLSGEEKTNEYARINGYRKKVGGRRQRPAGDG
jgi:hypothetical protein